MIAFALATILAYSQSNQNKIKDSFPEVGGVATQEEGHIGLWSSCFLSSLSIKVPFVAAVSNTFRFQRWGEIATQQLPLLSTLT